jgi:hypothetical protein
MLMAGCFVLLLVILALLLLFIALIHAMFVFTGTRTSCAGIDGCNQTCL